MVRTPGRRRPLRREFDTSSSPDELDRAAERVVYVGSAEHKTGHSWIGAPRFRSDATPCPRELRDPVLLTSWLAEAVREGHCSQYWEDDFPRYVWSRRGDVVYEARLVNRTAGTYKGYPLKEHEVPKELP